MRFSGYSAPGPGPAATAAVWFGHRRTLNGVILAGVLARAGWTVDGGKAFHRVIYRCLWPGSPDVGSADSEVQSTLEKYRGGAEVTGVPTLFSLMDKRVVNASLEWLGIERAQRRVLHGFRMAWLREQETAEMLCDFDSRVYNHREGRFEWRAQGAPSERHPPKYWFSL